MFRIGRKVYSISAGGYAIIIRMDIVLTFCEEDGRRSFPQILDGICRFARTRRWHVENISSREGPLNIDQLLAFWKPIGCIVEPGPMTNLTPDVFGGTPLVFLNHEPSENKKHVSVVEMDNAACVNLAINELLDGKPAQLGYVPFLIPSRPWNITRQTSFVTSLTERNMPFLVFRPRSSARRIQRSNLLRQLRAWLKALPKPCGILAANDETASVVAVACSMEELAVPQEVAAIGIDDDPVICMNSDPQLSSVRPNFAKGAYMAAKLLDRAIRHPKWKGKHVAYPPDGITRRDSTRFVLRKDPEVVAALKLIQAKSCTGLTADEVHETFSCSRRAADDRFRAATRQSILEMIHAVRLERMQELLSNPAQDLSAIANLCGYSSQNAACKFFRFKTGMTMTEWRRRHLG